MEEVAVAVVQAVLEIGLELLVYVGLDLAAVRDDRQPSVGCLLFGAFALVGAALGAVANRFHPSPVLPYPWLRLANLLAAPFLAGWVSWRLARWRQGRGRARNAVLHFWLAFAFVLGFNAVRFAYAQPGG